MRSSGVLISLDRCRVAAWLMRQAAIDGGVKPGFAPDEFEPIETHGQANRELMAAPVQRATPLRPVGPRSSKQGSLC